MYNLMANLPFIVCRDCGFKQRFIPIEADPLIFNRVSYDAKCPKCNRVFEVHEKEIVYIDP